MKIQYHIHMTHMTHIYMPAPPELGGSKTLRPCIFQEPSQALKGCCGYLEIWIFESQRTGCKSS